MRLNSKQSQVKVTKVAIVWSLGVTPSIVEQTVGIVLILLSVCILLIIANGNSFGFGGLLLDLKNNTKPPMCLMSKSNTQYPINSCSSQ